MDLVVRSKTYNFTLATNNLVTLRDTINSLNAGVTASILTTSGGTIFRFPRTPPAQLPFSYRRPFRQSHSVAHIR